MEAVPEMMVMADRTHKLAPPPALVFKALVEDREKWLDLAPGEVMPEVLEAAPDSRVTWSSFWPVSPRDTIVFDLGPSEGGTAVRFQWLTESPPDERGVAITRQRLNKKIGDDLREWVVWGAAGYPD
jgi:hypothetical protein